MIRTVVGFGAASWHGWSVSEAVNGKYDAAGSTGSTIGTSSTRYQTLAVAEWVRGSVTFPVSIGAAITAVKYKPNSELSAIWST